MTLCGGHWCMKLTLHAQMLSCRMCECVNKVNVLEMDIQALIECWPVTALSLLLTHSLSQWSCPFKCKCLKTFEIHIGVLWVAFSPCLSVLRLFDMRLLLRLFEVVWYLNDVGKTWPKLCRKREVIGCRRFKREHIYSILVKSKSLLWELKHTQLTSDCVLSKMHHHVCN